MKKQDEDELLLIVALGKSFNGTALNPEECEKICKMTILQLITSLNINETQANLLYKWACACRKGFAQDEKDNC